MNLWVRTQDGAGILKCEKLYIQVLNGEFHILNENEFPLGIYETRGKALEVLDEIQKKINMINLGHDFGSPMIDLNNPTYIYEMPKK